MATTDTAGGAGHDFIREMVADDLRTGKYDEVVTRFPPEPNGFLHIGHSKALCLNFGLANEFPRARCHLRFDDTNPETEDVKYVESIMSDVRWLGFDWGPHLYYASDYFGKMYEFARHMIRNGVAYVDSSTEEEIREARGTVMQAGYPTKFRDRSVDENLDLFARMRAGEFPDGAHVLRGKIDLASNNMLMRDPILFRIRHAHHYRQGDAWCIYPLYDYAHPIEDAIEGVTHSLCTLEFDNNRELYDWVIANLPRGDGEFEVPASSHPEQTEFARLGLDYTVMSKRKLLMLVNDGLVNGWDDPRMPTLAGLRRRGVTPESLRNFNEMIGIAKANTRVDIAKLEYAIRDDLNHRSPRIMCVLNPLKVVITNWPEREVEPLDAPYWPHDVPKNGTRILPFAREIYIERDDFMEEPSRGFFRLSPGAEVRLRYAYIIRCNEVIRNDAGEVVELRCTYDPETRGGTAVEGRQVRGTIHWVSKKHGIPCEVRLYDRLFNTADPEADDDVDFRANINPSSLTVVKDAVIEPSVEGDEFEGRYQFERLGYFAMDPDSRGGVRVYNRTVTLRDTWAKVSGTAQVTDGRPERKKPAPAQQQHERAAPAARSASLEAKRRELQNKHGIHADQAEVLTRDDAVAAWFDDAMTGGGSPVAVAKWLVNDVPRDARDDVGRLPVRGAAIGRLVKLVEDGEISVGSSRVDLQACKLEYSIVSPK